MILTSQELPGYAQFRGFATQFASAISQIHIDRGQWVGRLYRVEHEFELKGTSKLFGGEHPQLPTQDERDMAAAAETEKLLKFLTDQGITDIAISSVKYELDPVDSNPPRGPYFLVTGFIDIVKATGTALKTGKRYKFVHRIKATYHATSTSLEEVGDSPAPLAITGINLLDLI